MTELQKLEGKLYSHFGNVKQKTIDLIQNAELFFGDAVEEYEQLGAYKYEVGICLEIYDKSLTIDISLIKELRDILESIYIDVNSQTMKEKMCTPFPGEDF